MNAAPITVERLSEEKLSEVSSLEEQCFAEPWSEEALELLLKSGVGFVASLGTRAVGYVGMLTVLDEGQITNVAVDSRYRRQGIGRQLLSAIDTYAKEHGILHLSLEVRCSNSGAVSLYESSGWKKAGVRKGFYSHPLEDAFVMTKEITTERL